MLPLTFAVQSLQTVLYIENFSFQNKLGVATLINSRMGGLFSGNPQILDLPIEAPLEFPRIQLKDEKGTIALNIAPIRIDFIFNENGKPNKSLGSFGDTYFSYSSNISGLITEELHARVYRLALVLKMVAELGLGAPAFIHNEFLEGNEFFADSHSLEIHSLKKATIGTFEINRWFRIKTARTSGGEDNILFVECDINTLPDKPSDFALPDIGAFLGAAVAYARQNFNECFGAIL